MAKRKTVSEQRSEAWIKFKARRRIENDPGGYIEAAFVIGYCEGMAASGNRQRVSKRKAVKRDKRPT